MGTLAVMGAKCAPTKEPLKPPAPTSTTAVPPTGGVFTASLSGAQVVPPVASPASGSATVTLDATETMITVNVSFTDLIGTDTSARIHGPAAPGANGPVVMMLPNFPLGVTAGTYISQSLAITAAQVSDLKAGLLYIIISSTFAAAGEIRGQLTAVP